MKKKIFYLLSFIEGSSVMAAELIGAKMLTPYFGSSLYVWSSVLAITLGGLALGYFGGGSVSRRKNNEENLYIVLLFSAVFLILMPLLAKEVMVHTTGISFLPSIILSILIFLFPPVFFMGMVSPMIIQCLCVHGEDAGKTAGTVFAISTTGGIIATFLLGFYLIPHFGLTKPAIVTGIVLGVIPFIQLIRKKKFLSFVFLIAVFFSFNSLITVKNNSDIKILYASEGLLGQVIVADYPLFDHQEKINGSQRILFVNRSTQTVVTHKEGKEILFDYVNLIENKTKHKQGKALILGLGGGSAANVLVKNGLKADAVELDERMVFCARKYFGLNESVNVIVGDARHHIKHIATKNQSAYSVIVLDVFIGEVNPHHLFTKEFFNEIKSLLSDSGIFFINSNGFWNGDIGKGTRSVCKTLLYAGFSTEVIPTDEEENYRNILLVAKKSSTPNFSSANFHISDLNDCTILEDEKPTLEILNAGANKRWREACMNYFLHGYFSGRDKLLFR